MLSRFTPLSGLLGALLAVGYYLLYIYEPEYIFTPAEMSAVARRAIAEGGNNLNVTVESVVQQLRERHPRNILLNPPWIFNNAGGAMGSMLVLHCSLIEYVIIFGTALGTEGHTGRFLADDYFTMLHGEQWAFSAGSLERETYRPGDQHFLPRGSAKQYRMPDAAWALEYARGNIASMMPFGLADSFSSTFDLVSVWQTVSVSARGMMRELLMGKEKEKEREVGLDNSR